MMGKNKGKFEEIPAEKLKWQCDPKTLGFKTTDDIASCPDIIGQQRAIDALRLGLDIDSRGYNLFVNGLPGSGRKTAINRIIKETERIQRIPEDKIFVNNFKNTDMPILIRLKSGQGREFKKDMERFVNYLLKNIPEIFESDAYQERRKEKIEFAKSRQKELVKGFEDEASRENFALLQMQVGTMMRPVLLPVMDGKPANFERIKEMESTGKLSRDDVERMEEIHSQLIDRLENVFQDLKELDKRLGEDLKGLDHEMINPLVEEQIREIKNRYQSEPVGKYLDEVKESVQETPERFLQNQQNKEAPQKIKFSDEGDPFIEYRVNLLVDNSSAKKAPVIFETSPSYSNLFGTVEITPERSGHARTDFTKIKAGSFLKADGGYLIVEALDLLVEPGVWPAFKRTLKNRQVEIQIFAPVYMVSISAMKPKPIECNVKVALVGDPYLYQLLYGLDPDFKKIFKLRADFDSVMDIKKQSIMDYANFIKRIVEMEELLPLNNKAVAAVVEYGVRLAGKQTKLSTQFNYVADILRESNYWAKKDRKKMVTDEYVNKAVSEKNNRSALIEEKIQEMITRGEIIIDTKGQAIGQVNGLSVYEMGDYSFGKPSRITANVAVGDSGIINIEREAQMSGPIHNKGVLILSGYLRSRYARNKPLAVSASLCFEQSYAGVEGDSASSTEIYALLSALAKIPIRQDIAVTGSVNQKGEIQPIGGINEKIEGFFATCLATGLTGSQGVIIPHQNAEDLMLKDHVIEAVKKGKFHIYPIKYIDQGLEILTGLPHGDPYEDGTYPEGTVNFLVDRKLEEFADKWKQFNMKEKI